MPLNLPKELMPQAALEPPPPPQHFRQKGLWLRRILKIVIALVVIVAVIVAGVFAVPRLLPKQDAQAVDDGALRLEARTIPARENAFAAMQKLRDMPVDGEVLKESYAEMLGTKSWNQQDIIASLTVHEKLLSAYAAASARPHYQSPGFEQPEQATASAPEDFSHYREAAQLSAVKAAYLARFGQFKEAIAEAERSLHLGHEIMISQGRIDHYELGQQLKATGLVALQQIVALPEFEVDGVGDVVNRLETYRESPDALKPMMRVEYARAAQVLERGASHSSDTLRYFHVVSNPLVPLLMKDGYHFNANKTKQLFADYISSVIAEADVCGASYGDVVHGSFQDMISKENGIGEKLFASSSATYNELLRTRCDADTAYQAVLAKLVPPVPPPPVNPVEVSAPAADSVITSPLTISGKAVGTWYFEASFPVQLLDANKKVIAQAPAQAQGDWQTDQLVPFEAKLIFKAPKLKDKTGFLVLEKDNPSGLPENAAQITIPVKFK